MTYVDWTIKHLRVLSNLLQSFYGKDTWSVNFLPDIKFKRLLRDFEVETSWTSILKKTLIQRKRRTRMSRRLFSVADYVNGLFDELEKSFSRAAISKLASLITCSEYGLTETELLEILMPTSNSEAVISIEEANFNFSSLCAAKRQMGKFELVLWL